MDTSAWRAGFFDSAAALMSGAVPKPASLENRRAQPTAAPMMPLPTAPPKAREGEGAFEDQPERLANERPIANEDIGAAPDVRGSAHDGQGFSQMLKWFPSRP